MAVWYTTTNAVKKDTSTFIPVPRVWNLQFGDRVYFEAESASNPDSVKLVRTAKVTRHSNSLVLHLPKEWGFEKGELITIKVRKEEDVSKDKDKPEVGEPDQE